MIRKSLMAICLAFAMNGFAQDDQATEKTELVYSEVVEVSGAKKDQLFKAARAWFLENYGKKKQEPGVIYTDDSYLGEIAANPIMWVVAHTMGKNTNAGSVSYDIVVSAKEGKYKYNISNFYHESNRSMFGTGGNLNDDAADCPEEEMAPVIWKEIKEDTKQKTEALITSLKEQMTNYMEHQDEDW